MNNKEIILKSSIDNNPISVYLVIPNNPKGIVQIVHGMVEHKMRYINFMNFLADHGYIAVAADTRGHGKSILSNDDLGYFGSNGVNNIINDVYDVMNYIKKEYPNLKYYLFGHSFGSLIVRDFIKKYDKDIDKLIVCGSPSLNNSTKIGISIIKIMEKVKGDRYRSTFIRNLTFKDFTKGIDGNDPNRWICVSQKTLDLYKNDPLCNFVFTLNGFETLLKMMIDVYDKNNWSLNNLTLPILFISGKDDRAMINYNKWIESQELLKNIGYKNVTNKLYDGMRHEILNEDNNMNVYNDILEYIEN